MKDSALVSVIIPFYNNLYWLKQAVNSVLAQTYPNIEIIVINDGSREDLTTFLLEYENKIVYVSQKNRGPGAARNKGIEIAKGEYICFLDSDDLWLPYKVEIQLSFMLEHNYVWSHTAGVYFNEGNKFKIKQFDFSHNSGWVSKRSLISMQIATPSVMIKTEILQKNEILRFNVQMRYSQDTLFYQLLAQYYELGYLNVVCILVRLRSANSIVNMNANRRFRIRFTARATTLNFFHSSQKLFILPISSYTLIMYKLYMLFDVFLTFLEKKKVPVLYVENVSKLLFILLWLYGRIYIIINDYLYNFDDRRTL